MTGTGPRRPRRTTARGLGPRELRTAVSRHRVLLAGGLAAAAVAAGLSAVAPSPEPAVQVVTAARELVAGTPLTPDDLVASTVPEALVPAGALSDVDAVVGRLVAGPVRRGEPLTDVRLLGTELLRQPSPGGSDEVVVPVRVAEPAAGALVRPGDLIDVLGASPEGGATATELATAVRVLSVPELGDDPGEGALLVVAASRATAGRLAAAAVTSRLSLVVRSR
ncbi:MAG: hypothetical protein JWN88_1544 [Frankiales bacterium]|nr:hypothetical protein [Frankiales bacterium]